MIVEIQAMKVITLEAIKICITQHLTVIRQDLNPPPINQIPPGPALATLEAQVRKLLGLVKNFLFINFNFA